MAVTEIQDLKEIDIMETKNEKEVILVAIPNGPLQVKGRFTFKDSDGNVLKDRDEIYICRCGGSSNKPFCDGTHRTNGFQD